MAHARTDSDYIVITPDPPLKPAPAILTTPTAMRRWRAAHPGPLGLVPTMGYLHEGHLDLVRRARRELNRLRDAEVDAVYLPSAAEMYPPGFQTYVSVEDVTQPLEGAARPGHFRGVTTVVLKLFNAIGPDRAYFGKKDAQQLRVIQRMTRDLDLGVEIVPCEIVREPDGLAMSSRNVYLTPEQRAAAPVLKQALEHARNLWNSGMRDAETLRHAVRSQIEGEPLAEIDYISLASDTTLKELDGPVAGAALLSLVVRFGHTRLLDNVELRP